jgi:hypothetical protein
MRFRILPIFLIALGVGFLLGNLGVIPAAGVRELLHDWWPALLIAFGAVLLMRPRHEHWGRDRRCRREADAGGERAGQAPQA